MDTPVDANVRPSSVSTDGEFLLFYSGDGPNRDVGILTFDTDQAEILIGTAADETRAQFSPDGRFVAFASDETGQREVHVMEVGSGRKFPVSTSTRGGNRPRWSRDGREIYYMPAGGDGILVAEVDVEAGTASDPLELSDVYMRDLVNFAVTADAQRFLVTTLGLAADVEDTATATPRINVVLNWFEELKERVPTGR